MYVGEGKTMKIILLSGERWARCTQEELLLSRKSLFALRPYWEARGLYSISRVFKARGVGAKLWNSCVSPRALLGRGVNMCGDTPIIIVFKEWGHFLSTVVSKGRNCVVKMFRANISPEPWAIRSVECVGWWFPDYRVSHPKIVTPPPNGFLQGKGFLGLYNFVTKPIYWTVNNTNRPSFGNQVSYNVGLSVTIIITNIIMIPFCFFGIPIFNNWIRKDIVSNKIIFLVYRHHLK